MVMQIQLREIPPPERRHVTAASGKVFPVDGNGVCECESAELAILVSGIADTANGEERYVIIPPPRVPAEVNRYQFRVALLDRWPGATAVIATAPPRVQQAWAHLPMIPRDSRILAWMKTALSATDDDMDALFIAAAGIES